VHFSSKNKENSQLFDEFLGGKSAILCVSLFPVSFVRGIKIACLTDNEGTEETLSLLRGHFIPFIKTNDTKTS